MVQKCQIHISGMHCRSCEILIEDELRKIPGVETAIVSHKTGTADIAYTHRLDSTAVEKAITDAGYRLGKDKLKFFSSNYLDYQDLVIAGVIVGALYVTGSILGIFKLSSNVSGNFSSLPVVFLVGLTAGVSTCMALVGGLVLGVSARFSEKHPQASGLEKFKPHLYFNLGRIASYFALGGLIGVLGSIFQLSTSILGLLTVAVGMVMLILGGQLIEIFPILKKVSFTLPKSISRFFGIKNMQEDKYSHKNSALMGAATFFLPCGFTQAMQLYAMSTGNLVAGAVTMGVFALGTTPGLLGVGGLTAAVKGHASRLFFRAAGVVVILLSFFNISNGLNLLGTNPFNQLLTANSESATSGATDPNVSLENGVQVVKMRQVASGYVPNRFTIQKDVPVKWVITSEDSNTCAASIVSQTLGIRQGLQPGENVISFTPAQAGIVRFSCIMGMYTGTFNVIDPASADANQQAAIQQAAAPAQPQAAGGCGGGSAGGGCGGCGGGRVKLDAAQKTGETINDGELQLIKATYTQNTDIVPNQFTVKANQPVKFEIAAQDDGTGCMGSVTIPGLASKVDVFSKGKTTTFEFTPSKKGNFNITCAMGVPRGQIIVN